MRPPWRSTTFLQMAKPMPVPGYCSRRVQALEDQEDAVGELRIDADAVVADREQPAVRLPLGGDVDFRPPLAPEA